MDSPGCQPRILRFFSDSHQWPASGAAVGFRDGGMVTSGSFERDE